MSTICSNGKVTVVKERHGGMEASIYRNELEAVKAMVNHGALGGGLSYGCDQHIAALDELEAHINHVRGCIEELRRSEDHP